jgi:hypothetical protein
MFKGMNHSFRLLYITDDFDDYPNPKVIKVIEVTMLLYKESKFRPLPLCFNKLAVMTFLMTFSATILNSTVNNFVAFNANNLWRAACGRSASPTTGSGSPESANRFFRFALGGCGRSSETKGKNKMEMETKRLLDPAIQHVMGKPCILCGKPFANGAGVFVPNNSQSWGAPAGKQRYLVYPLCGECVSVLMPLNALRALWRYRWAL